LELSTRLGAVSRRPTHAHPSRPLERPVYCRKYRRGRGQATAPGTYGRPIGSCWKCGLRSRAIVVLLADATPQPKPTARNRGPRRSTWLEAC